MVVVRDANVETMGAMAELPPDLSPFRIGATGEWKGRGFEVIGRVRVEWEEGSWNEWCILYDASKIGWLAEAQGLLMVSFQTDPGAELSTDPSAYEPGGQLQLAGAAWTVDDVKQSACRSSEGELPHILPPNALRLGVDLTRGGNGFASIELSDTGAELYVGEFVEFDALKLNNLRPVPGWNAEVAEQENRTSALACPNCGAAVNLRAAGQTMSAVCGNCGTLIDTATPQLKIIQKADSAQQSFKPLLPIGQRGRLSGIEYEVIGLMQRRDSDCRWSEYLLFNPWQGFQWLVFFQGHWTLATRLPAFPNRAASYVVDEGRGYRLYAKSRAEVTGVLGEFYWKTRRGEKADVSDYISPPYVLSKEDYPDLKEFSWSRGCYLDRAVIEEGFGVKNLPSPTGIYLNQPNPYQFRWDGVKVPFFIALIALIVIQVFFAMNLQEAGLASASFVFNRALQRPSPSPTPAAIGASPSPAEPAFMTPHFQISGRQSRVVIEASAPVDNNWLDLDMDLVNVKTNESIPAELEVSYYHGYDDGYWSEGSGTARVSVAAVPPGEYALSIEPSAAPAITRMAFDVRVRSGGTFASNFLMSMALVLIYPAFLLWRGHAFELER